MKPDRLGCALHLAAIIAVVGVLVALLVGCQPADEAGSVAVTELATRR